jgi:hypothetical protein
MPFKDKLKDVDYFMNQMGHGIKDSFTEEQEKHIRLVLAKAIRIPSKKIIDLNVPFWFLKKYYMQFYVGEDRRKGMRKPKPNNAPSENIIERDYTYFYSLLPEEISQSLNFEQRRTIQDILKRCIVVPTKKIYESNKTCKLFKKDYYISFFLGYDKRKSHRSSPDTQMRSLNLSVRGFIYFLELAVAVGIIYTLIRIVGALFNFNPGEAFERGLIDEAIDERIDDRLNQGFSLPNPFQLIDYYWWNFLKPLI